MTTQKDVRARYLNSRVTEDEYQWLQVRAKRLGMTVSSYVRHVALNADIKTTVTG